MSTSVEPSSASPAGSELNNKPLFDPWERIAPLPPQEAAGAPKRSKTVLRDPWEGSGYPTPREAPTASPRPANEAQMKEAVKLTAEEQARSDRYESSAANIKELETEIARTKDSSNKKILQDELNRLKGR